MWLPTNKNQSPGHSLSNHMSQDIITKLSTNKCSKNKSCRVCRRILLSTVMSLVTRNNNILSASVFCVWKWFHETISAIHPIWHSTNVLNALKMLLKNFQQSIHPPSYKLYQKVYQKQGKRLKIDIYILIVLDSNWFFFFCFAA